MRHPEGRFVGSSAVGGEGHEAETRLRQPTGHRRGPHPAGASVSSQALCFVKESKTWPPKRRANTQETAKGTRVCTRWRSEVAIGSRVLKSGRVAFLPFYSTPRPRIRY